MWSIGLRERSEGGVGRRGMDAQRPVVPSRPRPPAAAAEKPWPDPRRLTPRQMVDLGHRLYIAGQLSFDDSRLLSCQPELHPDYATTVARVTGRRPAPDAPHDHVEDWERRLAFALRYTPDDDERIGRIQRIVAALTRLAVTASPPPPYRTRE